ncbi:hypothetical protein GOP47_0016683 [Adiantum capillus-veneris]|uniref:Uncharacterized protein n=1 Tax=Adiantum capillus-veneris TaxID=13818 RepID=A0A9D4UI51_ADICA|nr:hypothetical protein GOP47_0016683 [Adiantum capillus-veneris]
MLIFFSQVLKPTLSIPVIDDKRHKLNLYPCSNRILIIESCFQGLAKVSTKFASCATLSRRWRAFALLAGGTKISSFFSRERDSETLEAFQAEQLTGFCHCESEMTIRSSLHTIKDQVCFTCSGHVLYGGSLLPSRTFALQTLTALLFDSKNLLPYIPGI